MKSEKCDCLNRCGDDPWLADGRARPCAALVKERQRAAERERAREVLRSLLCQAQSDGQVVVTAADMNAVSGLVFGPQW